MTGASEDLLVAVYGLRRAAVERFTGNAYQSIANEIDELIQLLGPARENLPVGKGAAYGFATMLDEVRRLARTSTSGSQYSAITHKLDILASHLASGASAPAPAARVSAIPAAVAAPASASVAATAPAAALAVSASVPVTPPAGILEAVYGLRRAAEAQFTPKTVETQAEREKLVFRVKAQIAPELLQTYLTRVKTGLPGVAYVRIDANAAWPEKLQVKLPPQ